MSNAFYNLARRHGYSRSALKKDQVRIVFVGSKRKKLMLYRVPWKSQKWK